MRREGVNHMCQTDPVKGHVAGGFHSNQARTHLIWISQPSKLGWNENLQPHGPLLDQFDTTGVNKREGRVLGSMLG